ncbi:unnamed protein product [Leptidea sinapis]|uniref:Uncharacterized protein n=1 Tax=Leptidea sinapis TaxID=189913 RepID=A0A5E4PZS3_9NEOP|nr:unnamed protein product [Leptidea sinapis]
MVGQDISHNFVESQNNIKMSKIILFVLEAIAIQTAYSQCLNRIINGCAPNVYENLLPNNLIIGPQGIPILPTLAPAAPCLPTLAPAAPCLPTLAQSSILPVAQNVIPEYPYPTVVHDSSVANSLANALQLLVVSNLLSNTLPGPCELPGYPVETVLPMPALPGCSSYNYVY